MFWLAYRCDGSPSVMIVEAGGVISARMKAAMVIDGIDQHFIEGMSYPGHVARKIIPKTSLGRLLTGQEAGRILDAMVMPAPSDGGHNITTAILLVAVMWTRSSLVRSPRIAARRRAQWPWRCWRG
jgi:hypothetical protein